MSLTVTALPKLSESEQARVERYGPAGYRSFVLDRSELVRELLNSHTTKEVASLLETNQSTIIQWRRQGVDGDDSQRSASDRQKRAAVRLTSSQLRRIERYGSNGLRTFRAERAQLVRDLNGNGLSFRQIGSLFGVSHTLARKWCSEAGARSPAAREGPALIRYVQRNLRTTDWRVVSLIGAQHVEIEALGPKLGFAAEQVHEAIGRLRKLSLVVGSNRVALATDLRDAFKSMGRRMPRAKKRAVVHDGEHPIPSILLNTEGGLSATRDFLDSTLRSQEARRKYAQAIRGFCGWCDRRGLSTLGEFDPSLARTYRDELASSTGPGSLKIHMSAVRAWLEFLKHLAVIKENPWPPGARSARPSDVGRASWTRSKQWPSRRAATVDGSPLGARKA